MAPLFRWETLQLHLDSPQNSFEALCASLAERDTRFKAPADRFVRFGRPDGGVECCWVRPDGTMHGYQAKYHRTALGASQWKQLDASVERALASYPELTSLTVCLPHDLPHSPRTKTTTARDRWEDWKNKWENKGRGGIRKRFVLDLWNEAYFVRQLSEPPNAALFQFFFGTPVLQPGQVSPHVKEQIARVGPRYQPQLHVEHPLEPLFRWLTSTQEFRWNLLNAFKRLRELLQHPDLLVLQPAARKPQEAFLHERALVDGVIRKLQVWPTGSIATACLELSLAIHEAVLDPADDRNPDRSLDTRKLSDGERYERHRAWERLEAVTDAIGDCLDVAIREAPARWVTAHDSRFVAISGSGGCGKTHLLCRVAQQAVERGLPVVLLLGQSLSAASFQTDRHPPGSKSFEQLLEALNCAGAIAGCRGLLLIDAINEADEVARWRAELRAIAAMLERHPHVAIAVSVRDIYADYLLPSISETPSLVRIEHEGFAGPTGPAALRTYCDHYNITLPDVPVFNPELENPLFLSMLCLATAREPDPEHRRPAKPFPGGHIGFRTVFERFLAAKEKALDERVELDRDGSPTPLRKTVEALAAAMAASPTLDLTMEAAGAIAARNLGGRKLARNRLSLLEAEGLILRVLKREDGNRVSEHVRFAYDRMHSHFIVSTWLEPHKTPESAVQLLMTGGILRSFAETDRTGMWVSLCDEVVLQWPGRYRQELFDSLPHLVSRHEWARRYLCAMMVAAPDDWTASTDRWLTRSLEAATEDSEGRALYVLALLKRVGHPRLVEHIHAYLNGLPLAVRDSWWTTTLSNSYGSDDIELCTWPVERDNLRLGRAQALSYAIALGWLTTVTRRELRASATRAMAAVVGCALECAADVLRRFHGVNDPYVLESVTHAVYGACMRSSDRVVIRGVAEAVLELWPRSDSWPVDVLTRHSLAGIVELASHRNPDWMVDVDRVIPPYQSDWIGDVLTWKEIDAKEESAVTQRRLGFPHIVRSCIPEGGRTGASPGSYGDFGRYVVGSAIHPFFRPRDPDRPFQHDLAHRFIVTRTLQLGWKPELFEAFDQQNSWSGDRYKSPIERIGKKYQWIALREFLARAVDRYQLYVGWNGEQRWCRAPSDVSEQFTVDPSLVRIPTPAGRTVAIENTTQRMAEESLWGEPDDYRWLLSPQGFGDPAGLLQMSHAGGKGILLHGHYQWQEVKEGVHSDAEIPYRSISVSATAYAIKADQVPHLDAWMRSTKAYARFEPTHYGNCAFGELFWSRAVRAWSEEAGDSPDLGERQPFPHDDCPVSLIPLSAQYVNESDDAHEEHIYSTIPSRWLAEHLALRSGPREFEFTDAAGRRVCWTRFDVFNGVVEAGYAYQQPVVDLLEREGLRLVWWITGEKMAVDRADQSSYKGPILPFLQGLYVLEGGRIRGWSAGVFDEQFRGGAKRTYPPPFVLTPLWQTPAAVARERRRT